MHLFLKRLISFAIPPFLVLIVIFGSFFAFDPFHILQLPPDDFYSSIVGHNEDYVATERYLKSNNACNSYIFGSSRAGCGFPPELWAMHLDTTDRVFSFAASNESIFGIRGKLRLIDLEKGQIKNALLVIDTDVTLRKCTNSSGHLYIKHPLVSGESRREFLQEHLKDYVFTGFFWAYMDYRIFRTKREYMNSFLNFDVEENKKYKAFDKEAVEQRIQADPDGYYAEKKAVFYERSPEEKSAEPVVTGQTIEFLREIKGIFDKHRTNYKIVISPLFDQVKINRADLAVLNEVFGPNNVFDFSGKNAITEQKSNYYERSHYRQHVGKEILKLIYNIK